MTDKSIESKFRRLTDVEHVLLRPGRYVGSVTPKTAVCWALAGDHFEQRELTWNPGFAKLFDEVISNSVDHSKREEGKHLNTIRVSIDRKTGEISVHDNGGIPVVLHREYDEYVPALIFGFLRSGSNFDDSVDSDVTGQNGEGASLTNIFSTKFTVETCDGENRFKMTWSGNMMQRTEALVTPVKPGTLGYTKITYTPDYAHLGMTPNLLADNSDYDKLVRRVYDVAGCNPKLRIFLNDERIGFKSFRDYVAMHQAEFVYDETPDWQVAVAKSDEGYAHVSFVNTTETTEGGNHVGYVAYAVAGRIREFLKKKHKVDVKPTDIFNHMRFFINARIIRPRYSSQTKENLITEAKDFKTAYEPSEKFIAAILRSDVITQVLDWVRAKALAAEAAKLRELDKGADKVNPKRIVKLQDANKAGKEPERCILFLTEGDSAAKAGKSTGDRDTMGFLALRGVPANLSSAASLVQVRKGKDGKGEEKKENLEFKNIMVAMGLKLGEKVKSRAQLRYGSIGIMTDADHDGAGHITGLLINNLYRFWPELFELGVVHRFITPIVKVWEKGSKQKPRAFYDQHEFDAWKAARGDKPMPPMKYYKGLATSQDAEFKEYLDNIDDHLIQIRMPAPEDAEVIDLVFGKADGSADRRKEWLALTDADDTETEVDGD